MFITKALTEIQLRGELDRSEVMGFEPISGLICTKYESISPGITIIMSPGPHGQSHIFTSRIVSKEE